MFLLVGGTETLFGKAGALCLAEMVISLVCISANLACCFVGGIRLAYSVVCKLLLPTDMKQHVW